MNKNHYPKISVIVPCRNEIKYIEKFLNDIERQDYPSQLIELIIADGCSSDGTYEYLTNYKKMQIKVLINKRGTTPYALNMMIDEASGEYIVRMDVHASYPLNYFSLLISNIQELCCDNIGLAIKTLPANSSLIASAIAKAMSHPLGVGNNLFRTANFKEAIAVNTVPFGCFPKSVFDRYGKFDEELTRGQDAEFNQRIIQSGGKIYILPGYKIKYYARENFYKAWKMFYQYGLFRPLVLRKTKKIGSFRQIVPSLLVFSLAVFIILSIYSLKFIPVAFVILLFHFTLTATLLIVSRKYRIKEILLMSISFLVMHISYGIGYLVGLLKILMPRLFGYHDTNIKINR